MLGLTRRELETELRDGLRHRQRAKAVGNSYSPVPKATAPVLDPTWEGVGVRLPRATRLFISDLIGATTIFGNRLSRAKVWIKVCNLHSRSLNGALKKRSRSSAWSLENG